jgi:hypothetical protein
MEGYPSSETYGFVAAGTSVNWFLPPADLGGDVDDEEDGFSSELSKFCPHAGIAEPRDDAASTAIVPRAARVRTAREVIGVAPRPSVDQGKNGCVAAAGAR